MVDLNFTLVVQLLMFLGFLWAMNRWVLQPLIKFMDDRERQMAQAVEQAEIDQKTAEMLERDYAATLAAVHRKAHQRIMEALRAAQTNNQEDRETVRRRHEQEVAQARKEAEALIERERQAYAPLSHALAEAMMARLGMGDEA